MCVQFLRLCSPFVSFSPESQVKSIQQQQQQPVEFTPFHSSRAVKNCSFDPLWHSTSHASTSSIIFTCSCCCCLAPDFFFKPTFLLFLCNNAQLYMKHAINTSHRGIIIIIIMQMVSVTPYRRLRAFALTKLIPGFLISSCASWPCNNKQFDSPALPCLASGLCEYTKGGVYFFFSPLLSSCY